MLARALLIGNPLFLGQRMQALGGERGNALDWVHFFTMSSVGKLGNCGPSRPSSLAFRALTQGVALLSAQPFQVRLSVALTL
jgi:hypothetical protein